MVINIAGYTISFEGNGIIKRWVRHMGYTASNCCLQSRTKQTGTNDSSGILVIEEEITIRAKIGQMTSGERSLYSSITERNVINSINYGGGDIILELALQRRIWVSGSTIFCSLRIKNHSKTMVLNVFLACYVISKSLLTQNVFLQIKDVKVILLRRQNTYSQSSQNFQLMSVRSFCDVVSCTSIASLGSFDCLSSGQNENVILGLDTSVCLNEIF